MTTDKTILIQAFNVLLDNGNGPRDELMVRLRTIIDNTPADKISFDLKAMCHIGGSEIAYSEFVPEDKITERAQYIWDHPSEFCDYQNDTDLAYYGFLKFLWIEFPDGTEKQLAAFINELKEAPDNG